MSSLASGDRPGSAASRLDWVWRLAATGFACISFFAGGCLIAVLVFPFLRSGAPDERAQRLLQRVYGFYLWALQRLGVLRLEISDGDRLRACHGQLVVANHPTLLDVVLLMALVPRASCIVKRELFDSFALGRLVRAAGYIRNDLPVDELVAASRAILARGGNLIVFPEGTRTRPGQGLHFQRGFANIALLANVPIQPVVITCDPVTLTKGEPWYRIPPRRPVFRVAADVPLDTASFQGRGERGIVSRTLTRELEQFYTARLEHG